MTWASGALVFLITWWTTIFIVLPWGIERDERGIPINAYIKKKLVITTAVSLVIWAAVYTMVKFGIIDFRAMSEAMMEQDYGT
jgi:predicted secreted protein